MTAKVSISSPLKFHHFGLAVRDPANAIQFLSLQGYKIGETVFDPLQKVNLQICTHLNEPSVELVYESAGINSPIGKILSSKSEMIYHTCYEVSDHNLALGYLESTFRVVQISKPTPAVLFQNRKVSFYYIKGLGVVELLEASL